MWVYLSHQHSSLSLDEIGAYFGMKGSALSQLSRRLKETIKRDEEVHGIVSKIEKEGLLNVET